MTKATLRKNSALSLCYFPILTENENIPQLSSITTYLHGCNTAIAHSNETGSWSAVESHQEPASSGIHIPHASISVCGPGGWSSPYSGDRPHPKPSSWQEKDNRNHILLCHHGKPWTRSLGFAAQAFQTDLTTISLVILPSLQS